MPVRKVKSRKVVSKTKLTKQRIEKEQTSLSDFVRENDKLISTLGVFTALTIFSANLSIKSYGYALSFAFMALSLLLWFELWARFPSSTGSWRLSVFENILFWTVLAIMFYWLLDFRNIWHDYLWILLFALLLGLASYLIRKYQIFNRLFHTEPGKLKFLRYTIGIIIGVIVFAVSIYLSTLIAPTINQFLDQLNQVLKNYTP